MPTKDNQLERDAISQLKNRIIIIMGRRKEKEKKKYKRRNKKSEVFSFSPYVIICDTSE